MTISRDELEKNRNYALGLLVAELGDNGIDEMNFRELDPKYSDILPTTWQDLRDNYSIREIKWTDIHMLTGSGWYKGLKVTGAVGNTGFIDRMSKLCATLKSYIKTSGREEEKVLVINSIVTDSGLPYGFIYNAIESRLLNYEFHIKGAEWVAGQRTPKLVVRIPKNFGHPR